MAMECRRPTRGQWVISGLQLALFCAALCGCGGGGGNGGSVDGQTEQSLSGLMPAAPKPGAVLAADATTLRPLREGAVWRYHGVDLPEENAKPVAYNNERRLSQKLASGYTEADSNTFGAGTDSTSLMHRNGDVVRVESISLSEQMPVEVLEVTELKSPVRQSDRYVVYDRRVPRAIPDSDGDNVAEDADLAAYRHVVAEEVLVLGALGERRTIRVDFITLARARFSRDGRLGPVVTIQQSDWYQAGVGVVKRVLSMPTRQGTQTITEELVSWDGIDQGIGSVPAKDFVAPPERSEWNAAIRARLLFSATKVGQRVALVTSTGNSGSSYLVSADPDGSVRSVREVDPEIHATIMSPTTGWTSDGNRLLMLHQRWPNTGRAGWLVTAFDSEGKLQGPATGSWLEVPPTGPTGGKVRLLSWAPGDSKFWAVWITYPAVADEPARLILGAFTADGRPSGAVHELDADRPGWSIDRNQDAMAPALAVGPGGVLVTWQVLRHSAPYVGDLAEQRYAWLSASATSPSINTLGFTSRWPSPVPQPAVAGARGILAWTRPSDSEVAGKLDTTQLLRLDTNGLPIFSPGHDRANTPFIDTRRFCGRESGLGLLLADAGGVMLSAGAKCALWRDDLTARSTARYYMIADSDTPIAAAAAAAPMVTERSEPKSKLPLLFDDRLLWVIPIAGTDTTIQFATVWRR